MVAIEGFVGVPVGDETCTSGKPTNNRVSGCSASEFIFALNPAGNPGEGACVGDGPSGDVGTETEYTIAGCCEVGGPR